MKYYLSLFLLVFISCNQMRYQKQFDNYDDSVQCANSCFYKNISDSARRNYYMKLTKRYGDSMNKYYNLLYPDSNTSDKEETNKCNCK